jgi:uncharacterized membrane-anchored protein
MHTVATAFAATSAVVFLGLNGLIVHKEHIKNNGQVMLLKTAPRDPRSLMQGDYMALAYEIARQIPPSDDGYAVVKLDQNSVASYVRVHGGEPLQADEHLLRFRVRDGRARLGAEEFFFQEGEARFYERAPYAELRVSPSGTALLTGLRGPDFEKLGQK